MIILENILSQEIIQKLGWTLLHFIWQAAVVALLVAILLKVLRKSTANLRYIIACMALALIVLLPVITIQWVPVLAPNIAARIAPAPVPAVLPTLEMPAAETIVFEEPVQPESVTLASSVPWKQRAIETLEPALPYIVSGWLVGVFALSVWHLGGWAQLQRLRRKMVKQVDDTLHSKIKDLAERLKVSQMVQLMESALVQIPTVVGWLRPVILLPASALTGLTSEQLEAILAHELAHIRRCDYLINILQTVVEILGFYHPAVWWVSHKIRAERENCCDDLAVSISGDRVCYAGALTSMEEIRTGRGQLAVAAAGGNLFKRICRLLGKNSTEKTSFSWIPAVTAILLIIALLIPTAIALSRYETEQPEQKTDEQLEGEGTVEPQLIKLNSLPDGWKINYHSGMWPSGMARDLVQLRALPTPANEYDESWKKERLEFRIRSLNGERMGSILFWGERRRFDRITLSPGKYLLSYTRERTDPKTSCLIKMNRVEFPVDLSRRGTYTLVFSPKLEPLKTTDNKFLPTTCTGRVLNSKGEPLASAKVAAYELYFDRAGNVKLRLVGESVTKADGNFLFETRPSVRKNRSMGAEVVAHKEGLAVGWALWPLYGTQRATITLQEPTKLSGKVVDENGKSVPNAEVRAVLFKKKTSQEEKTRWLPGIQPFNWLSAHTDKDGKFEFNNIPQNVSSDLLVTASGFSTIYTRRPDRIDKGYEWAEFTAGQTDIKITMPVEAKIEGKVVNKRTGEGVAGVTLRVIPHFTPVFFERYLCTTKEDGTFNIGGLRSGKYVIMRTGTSNPKVDVVVESGKTIRNVILKIPYEVRNPESAGSKIVTPNENEQQSDSQVEDDILIATVRDKKSSANNIPVPVPAKSPTPSAQDKTIIQVDCLVVEVFSDSKIDRETIIMAENLLGNKISLRDTKVDVLLRKAAGATAATKDKSAENKRVTQDQFKALTDMLTSRGYLKILMNPTIHVADGQTAVIKTNNDSLRIAPRILPEDGDIIFQVEAAISSQSIPQDKEQTPISSRKLSTRVRVSPDESRIIGGLKETGKSSETDSNVKDNKEQATEVLFILTPTIITPTTDSQEKTDVRIESKEAMVHRVYDISDLVVTDADANDLIRRITETIEPDSWYKLSDTGYGTIIAYPVRQPKKFAVLQTRKIHQKIKRFLEDMRTSNDKQEKTKPKIQFEDSARKLSNLAHALLLYANDYDDKYPESLHELRGYLKTEDFAWTRQNVGYLAHGKTVSVRPDTVIAYDKKLLVERKGTNVLFNDSHVEFVKPERLKELGIGATAILIDTRLLSVSEDFLKDIGLDANSVDSSDAWSEHLVADSAAEPNDETYSLIIDDLHVSFLLKAVGAHKGAAMLASPQVLCQEGKTASIGILTEEYYVLGYTEPNDPSDKPESKTDKVETGTRIWLKPELTPDNEKIKLDFKMEFRQLLGYEERKYKGKYIYMVPRTEVVSTEMPCLIPDGKTMLIVGQKITEQVSGAPILSKLPVVGELFRSRDKTKDQRILLILVKPIINPQQKAKKILPGQEDSEEHIKHLANQLEKKLNPPAD